MSEKGGEQTDCFVAQDPSVRALEPVGCTDYLRRAAHDILHIASWPLTRPDGTIVCNSVGSPSG